ncbi:MAG: DUF6538 domain-containing protein [Nitrobacter sp.]
MEDVSHPRLLKRKNTYYLRASYPTDLLHLFKGKERWKSLGTTIRNDALRKVRAASAAFDVEMDRLRAVDAGPPVTLDQREIVRLCHKAYDYAIQQWEDQPGGAVIYEKFIDKMSRTNSDVELEAEIGPHLEELLSRSSTVGKIDKDTRGRFLPALRDTIRDAATTLLRRANNDYGTDHLVKRFGGAHKKSAQGLSLRRLVPDTLRR